jgi:hypothetical protein
MIPKQELLDLATDFGLAPAEREGWILGVM